MVFQTNPSVARVLDPPTGETRAWLAQGPAKSALPVIDAAQAVPNYPPADALMAHLSRFVREPESAFYTPIFGVPDLRDALAADMSKTYPAPISADQVAISSGGNHAFCMAVLALAGPGDNIILPEPYYFNHQMWFDMQGIETRALICHEDDGGMVPDLAEAQALIDSRTRAIVLVSPNNPTGTIFSPQQLLAFYELARNNALALIIDETYRDFLPNGASPHALFDQADWGDVFVHLYSFSKVFSLTGYRVGAIVGGGALMEAVGKIADTMTICAPRVGQEAALFGLRELGHWRAAKRDDLLQRLDLLGEAFERTAPRFQLVSRGAFFAYLRHPFAGTSSIDVSRRLFDEESLLTWPGSFFGRNQEDYIRLAFANADAGEIGEMVERLGRAGGI